MYQGPSVFLTGMDGLNEITIFNAELFGRRVAHRRRKNKIKQADLAERLGISQQHLSGIEHAKDRISFDVFLKLCVELKVNPDYLLGGTLRANNIPKGVVDGLNQCTREDQELAAGIIELLRKRNPENG